MKPRNLLLSCLGVPILSYLFIQLLFLSSELLFQETITRFENIFLDRLFISRYRVNSPTNSLPLLSQSPTLQQRENIVLVTIESRTLEGLQDLRHFEKPAYKSWNLSRWPFDRRVMGEAIEILQKYKASVIGLDLLYLHKTDEAQDRSFAEVLNRSTNVVLASMLEHTTSGRFIGLREPLEGLLRPDFPTGFVNMATDTDGIVRTIPIRSRPNQENSSISFALALFGRKPIHRDYELQKAFHKDNLLLIPHKDARRAPKSIHLWSKIEGQESLLVNWKGPANSFPGLRFRDLFDPHMEQFLKRTLPGKMVLIGLNHPGLQDVYPSPFYSMDKLETPGVEIHANALNTLMTVSQGSIQKLSILANFWIYLAFAVLLCTTSAFFRIWLSFPLFLVEGTGAWLLSNYLFQTQNILLSHADNALSLGLCYVCVLFFRAIMREREKSEIRMVFNQYVSNQVVDELLGSPQNLSLGGNSLEVSTLFSDIRGFTTLVERKTPEEVVGLLNKYFEMMVAIITKHGGTINKFIGDAIMVLYGAPVMLARKPDEQALACVKSAVEMQETLKATNDEGLKELAVGIGITTGFSVVGNIGASKHKDYTAIGDKINLAARLQTHCKAFEVIVDQPTYEYTRGVFEFETLKPFQVKGKEEIIQAYKVLY
jgi:adenylate cyclase